jgi:hypothetical protein
MSGEAMARQTIIVKAAACPVCARMRGAPS